MTDFMSIEQVVNAARNDIKKHVAQGTFKGHDYAGDDEENFYTITSLYAQWARDKQSAEDALDAMYAEEFPEFEEV